jgi:hypothetical protein
MRVSRAREPLETLAAFGMPGCGSRDAGMMASLGANLATWRPGHMATAGIWIRPFGNRLLRS